MALAAYKSSASQQHSQRSLPPPPPQVCTHRPSKQAEFSGVHAAPLQAHIGRVNVSGDLQSDQRSILPTVARLLYAAVDIITSSSWLNPGEQAATQASYICAGKVPGAQLAEVGVQAAAVGLPL